RLADRVGGLLRADGEDGDLAAVLLLEPERLLDGVLVELVDHTVGGSTVYRAVRRVELAFGLGVRDLLDQDDNIHVGGRPPCPCLHRSGERSGRGRVRGFSPRVPNSRTEFGAGSVLAPTAAAACGVLVSPPNVTG